MYHAKNLDLFYNMSVLVSKFKNVIILLCILGVVLVILGIAQGVNYNKNSRSNNKFFNTNIDNIDRIQITGPNQKYENILEKRDNYWVVVNKGDFLANPDYVAEILNIFNETLEGEIASRNAEKQANFQVDDLGIKIKAWNKEKQVIDVIIGKQGPSFTTTYVRNANSNNTYLLNKNIQSIFSLENWRDKRIWIFDPATVSSINWKYEEAGVSLIKKDGAWQQISPIAKESSNEIIDSILVELSSLYAIDIIEDITKEEVGLSEINQDIRIELVFESGQIDALIIGRKIQDTEEYYISRENSNIVWTVDSWTVENSLKKEIDSF